MGTVQAEEIIVFHRTIKTHHRLPSSSVLAVTGTLCGPTAIVTAATLKKYV